MCTYTIFHIVYNKRDSNTIHARRGGIRNKDKYHNTDRNNSNGTFIVIVGIGGLNDYSNSIQISGCGGVSDMAEQTKLSKDEQTQLNKIANKFLSGVCLALSILCMIILQDMLNGPEYRLGLCTMILVATILMGLSFFAWEMGE